MPSDDPLSDPSAPGATPAARRDPPGSVPMLAWVLLAALAGLSVALSRYVVTPEIWLDDPYIGFRYGANLERGLGLVYNAGERVEGYTAWLWVLFAYFAAVLEVDPLLLTQWINVASQVVTLFVLFRLGVRRRDGSLERRSPLCSLLAPALVATHVANVSWSMLGLSASFLMLLVVAAVALLARDAQRTVRGSLGLGTILLLIALLRFDGLVLSGVLIGWALLVDRQVKRSLPALGVLVVGLVVFNAWRYGYYGHPFPNTFYAKQSTFRAEFEGGTRYVMDFFRTGGPYGLLTLGVPFAAEAVTRRGLLLVQGALLLVLFCVPLLAAVPRFGARIERRVGIAAWTTAGHLGYVTLIGGDWMVDYRFILPVLPLLAFLLQQGLWLVLGWAMPSSRTRRAVAWAAVFSLLLWNVQPLYRSNWTNGVYHTKRPAAYWNAAEAREIGRHLDQALPPDALIAVEWAGIIPYYVRQPVFDIFGLNDADIMLQDFPGSRMGRAITPEYLVERNPQVVIVVAVLFDTPEAALAGIDLRPEGAWIETFFSALRSPEFGYEVAVTKVAEGSYYPFLIQADVEWRDRVDVTR